MRQYLSKNWYFSATPKYSCPRKIFSRNSHIFSEKFTQAKAHSSTVLSKKSGPFCFSVLLLARFFVFLNWTDSNTKPRALIFDRLIYEQLAWVTFGRTRRHDNSSERPLRTNRSIFEWLAWVTLERTRQHDNYSEKRCFFFETNNSEWNRKYWFCCFPCHLRTETILDYVASDDSLPDGQVPNTTCLLLIVLSPCLFMKAMLRSQLQTVALLTTALLGGVSRGAGCPTPFRVLLFGLQSFFISILLAGSFLNQARRGGCSIRKIAGSQHSKLWLPLGAS